MNASLSPNTQAILLLTAPLMVGRRGSPAKLLTPGEYKRLARHLRDMKQQPADLLSQHAEDVLAGCQPIADKERIRSLLERGFLLSQAIERWSSRAIWVVSRADPTYPRRLKSVMKEEAPAVLYGCGEKQILDTGGLAVVGSRHVDDDLVQYTEGVGRLAAQAHRTLVSGGARGIDQAAMRGALQAGGKVTGVMANGLEQASMNRENRSHLMGGSLVLVSPYDPGAGFNVGNAMQRNKLIYAFSNAALVVNSDVNKGGTWAGATEQLNKLHFVPVYVRSTGEATKGLEALQKKGAKPWPNPKTPEELVDVLHRAPAPSSQEPAQETLPLLSSSPNLVEASRIEPPQPSAIREAPTQPGDTEHASPSEALFSKVRELLLDFLESPKREAEVASALDVTSTQARTWLKRLIADGLITRRSKPVSYVANNGDAQSGLAQATATAPQDEEKKGDTPKGHSQSETNDIPSDFGTKRTQA